MSETLPVRQRLLDALLNAFRDDPQALALYQGGSAVFARNDEYSDLDLQLVVNDDHVDEAVKTIERTLGSAAGIEAKYIIPQPAWHGGWQGFYRLRGAGPYLLVDILVLKQSAPSYFSEPELHGNSIVYFDRTGKVGGEHLDQAKNREQIRARIARIAATSDLFHCFVDKEAARGRPVDAMMLYHQMVLSPLVETLRMIHCPDRFSFGPRYLQYDLPAGDYRKVADLYYVATPDQLPPKKKAAYEWLRENLEQLQREYQGPAVPG
jgi:hypothetical protein